MTKKEAKEIKGEIIEKEGCLEGAGITIDGLVKLDDVLTIINHHISEKEIANDKSREIY